MVAFPVRVLPNTAHSVFYAYALATPKHQDPIGSFEKFGSSFTRSHERIREVMFSRGPITKEIVWGGTDIQVTLSKVELYKEAALQALGVNIFTIEDFNIVIDVFEYMYIPNVPGDPTQDADAPGQTRTIIYKDCVPTTISKDVDTTTAKVIESMTLECRTVEGSIGTGGPG
jgi:hypothetical protein